MKKREFNLPDAEYFNILNSLKAKIRSARIRASVKVNAELLGVYWDIGNLIAEQESQAGWGAKIVERLAQDLKVEFPDMKGLSSRNLRYMRDFALAYPRPLTIDNQNNAILQGDLAKLAAHIDSKEQLLILQGNLQN